MNLFDWLYFSNPSFLLLIPLTLFIYIVKFHNHAEQKQLTQFIDAKLLAHLHIGQKGKSLPSWIGLLCTCLLIIGIAGVSWEKSSTKTFISPKQTILMLDQSLSLYATDIKPNRLTRLKQKVRDLLAKIKEGDIAITAFAGDAYVISPFSQDKSTLTHFLLALDPMIMPLYGSDLVAAFETSLGLIKNQEQKTHLVLFTDEVKTAEIEKIKALTTPYNLEISIIGIGTQEGATVSLPTGQLLQTQQGVIQVKLPERQLKKLASELNANYFDSNINDKDISAIASSMADSQASYNQAKNSALQWEDKGHWLAFPFLLWLLYQFRSGVLFGMLFFITFTQAPPLTASPLDWFTTPDQQAQKLANQGDWQTAKSLFQDPSWQAASEYALGEYEKAASLLENITSSSSSAEFFYNKGNSLALSGKLEESIKVYERALAEKKDFPEAQENLQYIKTLLEEQEKKDQEQQANNNSENNTGEKSSSGNKEQDSTETNNAASSNEQEESQSAGLEQQPEQGKQNQPDINTDDELSQEDKIALDQWMRQIQDDPGGLLKRKLWYLHREKRAENSYRQQDGLPIW